MSEVAVVAAVGAPDCGVSPWLRANEIAGDLNRLYAELVAVTESVIAADDWGAHGGIRSPEHWLALRAGVAPSTAGHVVALARRADVLPLTMELFGQGQLSLDQAAVIARHVPSSYEASVVDLAPKLTVAQLRRALSRYPFEGADKAGNAEAADNAESADITDEEADPGKSGAEDPGNESPTAGAAGCAATGSRAHSEAAGDAAAGRGAEPDCATGVAGMTGSAFGAGLSAEPELSETAARAGLPGRLTTWWDRGRFYVRGDLPADLGALLEQALKEAKDALFATGATAAGPADALAEIANRSLGVVDPVSRADRYRIYLHLDAEGAWLNGRGAIPRHLADRYACTSAVTAVLERDGKPVSVGRTQRGIPARTRRLVEDRDRGCAYPGCTVTRFVEIHHIEHWEDGGATDYDNLISLCPHHHTGHHQGAFTISPARDTSPERVHLAPFVFHDNRGRIIQVNAPPPRPGPASATPGDEPSRAMAQTYRGPLGEHLDTGWVRFYSDSERAQWLKPLSRVDGGHSATDAEPPDLGCDSARRDHPQACPAHNRAAW